MRSDAEKWSIFILYILLLLRTWIDDHASRQLLRDWSYVSSRLSPFIILAPIRKDMCPTQHSLRSHLSPMLYLCSSSLTLILTAPFLHLSHPSIEDLFVIVTLETAMYHIVYCFTQIILHTNIHCKETFWFKFSDFLKYCKYWTIAEIVSGIAVLLRIKVNLHLHRADTHLPALALHVCCFKVCWAPYHCL